MKRFSLVAPVALLALLSFAAWAHPARADVKEACVNASTQGQSLRDAAKLIEARAQFVECARDACPGIVRKACADWLADADRRLPTIVFRAQGADGSDVLDARVSLDGKPLARGLGGSAIAIDPGEHNVRFERDGAAAIDERVVVVDGEKGRVVTARFGGAEAGATATQGPGAGEGADASSTTSSGRTLTPPVLVLGGVGVVGLGTFVAFAIVASGDLNNLRKTCAPYCSSSQLSSVKTEALVADVSLGIGVVALAAATYVFFRHPSATEPAVTFDVRPERGGAFGAVGARF